MTNAGLIRRLLALSVAGAGAAAPASAAHAPIVLAASPSGAYRATIARVGTDAAGFARYDLTWKHGDDGGSSRISSEIQEISSFTVLDDGRAIIVGATGVALVSAFHAVALADAKTIVVDECYAPATSPDGRYIAYVRIHPQERAAAGRVSTSRMSAEYRVIDLASDRSVTPTSYAIDLQRPTTPGHAHVLAMPIVWENAEKFHFGDRFAGRVNRVYVEMDGSGKPKIESAAGSDS